MDFRTIAELVNVIVQGYRAYQADREWKKRRKAARRRKKKPVTVRSELSLVCPLLMLET